MARTMAQRKAHGGKAPRKASTCSSGSSSSGPSGSSVTTRVMSPGRAGKAKARLGPGNSATQWDTPKWQKGITCFFKKKIETEETKHVAADSTTTDLVINRRSGEDKEEKEEEEDAGCSSQSSVQTLDLNEKPNILSIFDETGASSSDSEQPGPSTK